MMFSTTISDSDETGSILVTVPQILLNSYPDTEKQIYDTMIMSFTNPANYWRLNMLLSSSQKEELLELLFYSMRKHTEFGIPFIQVEIYEDTEEPAYLNLVFENCNWDEWKSLEEELFSIEDSLRGMVAITYLQGLTE
jgi:hypothetical protein